MAARKLSIPQDCCGECRFFHEVPKTKPAITGCFLAPPEFSHMDDDVVRTLRIIHLCDADNFACRDFKQKLND